MEEAPARGSRSRFSPPPPPPWPEVDWALLRAFGPPGARFRGSVDATRAVRVADRLSLSARIAARHGPAIPDLPSAASAQLVRTMHRTAVNGMSLESILADVTAAAGARGIPVAFLKRAALVTIGVTRPEARWGCDVDVLAPRTRAGELQEALAADGFLPSPQDAEVHHLPPLTDERRGGVDIHTGVWGIASRSGDALASFEELQALGALLAAPSAGSTVFVPSRSFLAAHALIHAVVQHGDAPSSYPLANAFADLIDLGLAGSGGGELVRGATGFLDGTLDREDLLSVAALCGRLAEGAVRIGDETGSELGPSFLRHVVSGAFEPDYRRALKLRLFNRSAPSMGVARQVARTLFPERARLAVLYPALSRHGRLGLARVIRPVHLAGKLVAYSFASLRRASPFPLPPDDSRP